LRIGAIDLETFMCAAMYVGETHVVEHGAGVEQFRIETQTAMFAGQGAEIVDPAGMMEQQRRLGVSHQLSYVPRQLAVGNADAIDRQRHESPPSGPMKV
jgi:hypothetical protein